MPLEVESQHWRDECHVEQVKSVRKHMHSISCTAVAAEVGISPASVYPFLINSLGKQKVCGHCIPHVLNPDQRAMRVHLSTTHLQHWRSKSNTFLDCILIVDEVCMHSFDPHPKFDGMLSDVQNRAQHWGWGVVAPPPCSPNLAPCDY